MYTDVVDRQKVASLKAYIYLFPALYQPYREKAREWRVTVVGEIDHTDYLREIS